MNKPGSEVEELKGGVAGGSILQGVLKMGQEVEVRPGIIAKDAEGKVTCTPIRSRIVSLFAGEECFVCGGFLFGFSSACSYVCASVCV